MKDKTKFEFWELTPRAIEFKEETSKCFISTAEALRYASRTLAEYLKTSQERFIYRVDHLI